MKKELKFTNVMLTISIFTKSVIFIPLSYSIVDNTRMIHAFKEKCNQVQYKNKNDLFKYNFIVKQIFLFAFESRYKK